MQGAVEDMQRGKMSALAWLPAPKDYRRTHAPATLEKKDKLRSLSTNAVKEPSLAGETIASELSRAPGNDAPIGGLKVTTPQLGQTHIRVRRTSYRDPRSASRTL
jgi:phosphoglucomutase